MSEEVDSAVLAVAEERSASAAATAVSTNFTCGSHFYEEVEDLKDSVWLVQVSVDVRFFGKNNMLFWLF